MDCAVQSTEEKQEGGGGAEYITLLECSGAQPASPVPVNGPLFSTVRLAGSAVAACPMHRDQLMPWQLCCGLQELLRSFLEAFFPEWSQSLDLQTTQPSPTTSARLGYLLIDPNAKQEEDKKPHEAKRLPNRAKVRHPLRVPVCTPTKMHLGRAARSRASFSRSKDHAMHRERIPAKVSPQNDSEDDIQGQRTNHLLLLQPVASDMRLDEVTRANDKRVCPTSIRWTAS